MACKNATIQKFGQGNAWVARLARAFVNASGPGCVVLRVLWLSEVGAAQITELPVQDSLVLRAGFIALSGVLAVFLAWWSRKTAWVLAWTLLTAAGALTGVFGYLVLPPPALLVMILGTAFAARSLLKGAWRALSLPVLVGFQSFRILVELLIHQAVLEGVAPPQMTWTGQNLDILAGLTALLLGPFAARVPIWLLWLWNLGGLALLCNVVAVAILSLPLPFQQFWPDNLWVMIFPYQWLPMILVLAAFLGHLALWQRLKERSHEQAA